jgi:hypothetical protein
MTWDDPANDLVIRLCAQQVWMDHALLGRLGVQVDEWMNTSSA